MSDPQTEPPIHHVNVEVSEDERQRILSEETKWTGPKLVILTFATLAVAVAALYAMANYWYWMHWI